MLKPKILLAAMSASVLAAPALAQSTTDHSAHSAHSAGAMAGYMAAMDAMMETMADTPATGDADADFLLMMIPHHQSAIDMARVELDEGADPETREMAEKIIAAQEQEIADMKAMLARLGVEAAE